MRKDGSKYEGEFVDGRAHGQGQFTHPKGDVYPRAQGFKVGSTPGSAARAAAGAEVRRELE